MTEKPDYRDFGTITQDRMTEKPDYRDFGIIQQDRITEKRGRT